MYLNHFPPESVFSQLVAQKDDHCVTLIVPLNRHFSKKHENVRKVAIEVNRAKQTLLQRSANADCERLMNKIESLAAQITFDQSMEGIGLFVSESISVWVPFLFPVRSKLVTGTSFETRDLLFQQYFAQPYNVLLLSKNEARLFAGVYNQLVEKKTGVFPLSYEDDYEYSHPSRGQSYQGYAVTKDFEREKSQLLELREQQFLQQIESALKHEIRPSDPLIVGGAEKPISNFLRSAWFCGVIGRLHGNYSYLSTNALGDSTWRMVRLHMEKKLDHLIRDFEGKLGTEGAVSGLIACWAAAIEGRGALLIVERSFSCTGYLANNETKTLHLDLPPAGCTTVADVVPELIDLVQEKGGVVTLADEGALKSLGRVGLVLRY